MADITITPGNVVPSAAVAGTQRIFRATAGATITAGQLIYLDTADASKAKLADANSATALARVPIGIAINGASSGQEVAYVKEDNNLAIGATVSNGAAYVLSATPGGIAPIADQTTGWFPCIVAVGISSTRVAFRAEGLRSSTAL
jgi:hypothetical protein